MATALAAQGLDWIVPVWPAPSRVHAFSTTRNGVAGRAISFAPSAPDVASARELLRRLVPDEPVWLRQVHGTAIANLDALYDGFAADGAVTRTPGTVCAVLTADCLPILLADRDSGVVAVAHAGWRGLAKGVIEAAVAAMHVEPSSVLAWLGPAIGPRAFEVGSDVFAAFCDPDPGAAECFVPSIQEDEREHEMARRSLRASTTQPRPRRRRRGLRRRALHADGKQMLPFVSTRRPRRAADEWQR